jgi:hypothetical protein
MKARL